MDKRPVRTSAKALLIREGKVAAVRLRQEQEEWYILPGGGQEAGELLPAALRREVAEELGLAVEPRELAFVIEGAHGEPFHRVDLVFRCEILAPAKHPERKADSLQVGMDWLPIATLNRTPLYPSRLRRAIMNLYDGKPYPVYLGNEEMGDPEIIE